MSLSEGDLSQSIDSLNLSDLDERSPLKKRPRNSTETIETKFKQLQTPIYLKERLNNDEIANILTDTSAINRDKVCSRIPAGPPGKGQWSFLIDLEKVKISDLAYDAMGSWGNPSGRSLYFRVEEGKLIYIGRDKKPDTNTEWNFRVKTNRYNHPGAKSAKFVKVTYVIEKPDMSHSQFAMVCYEATIDPSEVRQVAHKNAKNQDKGMPRTKPSVLKRERELLPSHTPMQVNRAILQEAGGVSTIYSPVDMPASQQQIRDQSRKVPDSKRTTAAGRPAMNQYDKIEKQMSRPGSIVTDMEYFVTEKDTLGIRLFLCDPRGLAVMKKFGLTSTKPAQLHTSLNMDPTYSSCIGHYLTPIHIRDPRFFNKKTANPPILVVGCILSSGKTTDDYEFGARCLVKRAGLQPNDRIKTWVTDGEEALIKGRLYYICVYIVL